MNISPAERIPEAGGIRLTIALIYGPDRNLVAEGAKLFAAKSGVALDDTSRQLVSTPARSSATPAGWPTRPARSRCSRRAG
jgi:hypothetical protein